MKIIGLDIGTTSICATVISTQSGEVLKTLNANNGSFIVCEDSFAKIQDATIILKTSKDLIARLIAEFAPIAGIGLTGQMHGIVYINQHGDAVSPLFTWQDGRGDLTYEDQKSYAESLSEMTGYPLATGFGAVTHFYNFKNGLVPSEAVSFCTISDFVAMQLAGLSSATIHSSHAASVGLFDLQNACFDRAAIEDAGFDFSQFPTVANDFIQIGLTKEQIPVIIAIGDNQASFIGSVSDMKNSILVNVGTGSQLSFLTDHFSLEEGMEIRAFNGTQFLMVCSSLCGGRAYAILHAFFQSVLDMAGLEKMNLYPFMDQLSEDFADLQDKLEIHTQFSGTREDPAARGKIFNVSEENFTPQHFIVGVLEGVVNELFEKFAHAQGASKKSILVGAGNGIRKGKVLQKMFAKKFGLEMRIPLHEEEAAFGAALAAAVGIWAYQDIETAQASFPQWYVDD
ncbi:MAG: FGGY family carbohydrate kinase [Clostridia bacterium]